MTEERSDVRDEYLCYTDGSCKAGPGAPGGWGFCIKPPSGPDFDGISASQISISAVKQKLVFKLDKKGVEAAAITYQAMDTARFNDEEPRKPIEIVVDRPYLFYLASRSNKQVLFLGQFVGEH